MRTTDTKSRATPTVFVSYVTENAREVDRLVHALRSSGIAAWLDKDELLPGYRWRTSIRHAIEYGDFFLACFSQDYVQRASTYMNEELVIAIEELRKRRVDRTWFIPVLLSDCDVPDRPIGAGETLRSLQFIRLYEDWDGGIKKLMTVIDPTCARLGELEGQLCSSSARARISALDNLGRMGSLAGPAIKNVIALLEDDNETVSAAAADALGKIGETTEEVVRRLLATIKSKDYRLYPSVHAERSLVRLGAAAVPFLMRFMIENQQQYLSENPLFWASRNVMVKIGAPAVPALIEAFHAVEDRVKPEVLSALGEVGSAAAAAVPILLDCLKGNDRDLKGRAVGALGQIGDRRAIAPLVELLSDPYWNSADALGAIGDRSAVPHLIAAMKHPQDHGGAEIALGKIGDHSAVPFLIEVLRDRKNSSQKRAWAAFSLGLLGSASKDAVPYIVEMLNEDEFRRYDQEKLRAALARISEESSWTPRG